MKLLLDECAPKRLKRDFAEHQVFAVDDVGLEGVKNGELLRAAADQQFECFDHCRSQDAFSTESHRFAIRRPYSNCETLPVRRIKVADTESS